MPAGCDFICENEECKQYKSGFSIISSWPLGEIDLVIKARNVQKDEEFAKGLANLKKEGRKYCCITYPNIDYIPTVGYRVDRWCSKCKRINLYDVMLAEENEDFEKALERSDIPDNCFECGNKLLDFEGAIEEKINCPHCHKELKSNRWFSNETYEEVR